MPSRASALWFVSLLATATLSPRVAESAEPPPRTAADYTVDGFKLGDDFSKVAAKAPYSQACDNDPIDHRARRFMVYGGKPCRERTFPAQTSVMLYLAFQESKKYEAPIEVIAWLGGHYFDNRSNFPVTVGTPLPEGDARKLSAALELPAGLQIKISWKSETLQATRFGRDVWILDDGANVVGVVLGVMPEKPDNEQWSALMQTWGRYTK